ncbi:hypothetical protein PGTUg99_003945 [Puccinia graminis f. sp. tritici]|uniref:Uncharacterized protein n=1 Tax=Puccinia graminis f. sp. tritici TaxID=56615 RepID=A0A5B0NP85_PUCGR|nr:hypothetical protein PGTUg99_003945 [Puccinia graminis f. sp. tritici]
MTSSVPNKHRGPEAAKNSHTLPRTYRTSIKGGLGYKPHRFKLSTTCHYRRQTRLNHRLDAISSSALPPSTLSTQDTDYHP